MKRSALTPEFLALTIKAIKCHCSESFYFFILEIFFRIKKYYDNNTQKTVFGIYSTDKLEKEMAPHSSTLAWEIPWMEEPGGLQSMGSLRVGHN